MNTKLILYVAIISAVLYGVSTVLRSIEKFKKVGLIAWILAIVGNIVLVGNNWIINGYVPFVSMYQVLTFVALTFSLMFVYVKYLHNGGWMDKYFCLLPAVCLTGVCFMGIGEKWHFPPALQSPWFVPHVLVYMISYTLVAVAFILTVESIFNKSKSNLLDSGIYTLICIAYPFMTSGMLFGAMWANEVWGNFWSFDAKENWSLVTWLMLAIYLHFRRHKALQKYSKIFVVLGFFGVIITMFFVNIMGGSSQHAYS
ncbi:MAG: hypothetical protein E7561_03975 [Ruminococcaceae bacterium]|nr:hypothetical protein [Oscillospiraceae bacterium]